MSITLIEENKLQTVNAYSNRDINSSLPTWFV